LSPGDWLEESRRRLRARGFNLVGVADAARFDAGAPPGLRLTDAAPWVRSAVLVASGGRGLWEALPPRNLAGAGSHPIDDHTRATLDPEAAYLAAAIPGARVRLLFPFDEPAPRVSFLRLAEEAGLGTTDTVLGLLLHPEFGPWVSLRACLITDLELPAAGRLRGFRPCDGCARPCLEVCPARVLNAYGWDHAACFEYRRRGPNCLEGCRPRIACPVGAMHRYGPDEMRHRQLAALD
jgi:hypothetical protein